MTFSQSISSVFSKCAIFSGRASRSEYWYFVLFNFLVSLAITVVALAMSPVDISEVISSDSGYVGIVQVMPLWANILLTIYSLAVLLPTLTVTVRRLHDTGRGGGWIFINFVPLIGGIWFFVLMVLPGEPHGNRFGPVPTVEPCY